jgi:hypothetical protein
VTVGLGLVVGVPGASAAITGSQITTPSDPTFGLYVHEDETRIEGVSGTTTGGTAGDLVDIRCTWGPDGSESVLVDPQVPTAADGSFSIDSLTPTDITDRMCRLRAVPTGTTPAGGALDAYGGPLMMFGEQDTNTVLGGPNDGKPFDFYVWAQQNGAAADYYSIGSCGLCDGYLFNSDQDLTATTFYANDFFYLPTGATRSQLQVDGVNAYAVNEANNINTLASSGFPDLSYQVSQNPSTGDTTITESEEIVRCPDATFPPDETSCATFVDTGVRADRTIVQNNDGHLVTITDRWMSTDGQAHHVDLLPENDQQFLAGSGSAVDTAYEFPGETSFSTHAPDDVVDFGGAAPGVVYVNHQGSPDDETGAGQGAIVFDRPANPATFIDVNADLSSFTFHQTADVPAGDCATLRTAYAQDYTSESVQSLAQAALTAFATPAAACTTSGPSGPNGPSGPTGRRAAAKRHCKKKFHKQSKRTHNRKRHKKLHKKLKKCVKRAKKLPV